MSTRKGYRPLPPKPTESDPIQFHSCLERSGAERPARPVRSSGLLGRRCPISGLVDSKVPRELLVPAELGDAKLIAHEPRDDILDIPLDPPFLRPLKRSATVRREVLRGPSNSGDRIGNATAYGEAGPVGSTGRVMEEVPIVTPLAWRKDLVPARSGLNRVPRLRKDLHACTAEPVECPLLEANTVTLRTNPSIDIANHVARRKHPLGVFIGNRNLERFLDSHDEL